MSAVYLTCAGEHFGAGIPLGLGAEVHIVLVLMGLVGRDDVAVDPRPAVSPVPCRSSSRHG